MSSILTFPRQPAAEAFQYFFWLHPEWWAKALCGVAWVVMLLHAWRHAGHQVHHWMTFPQELAYWMWMTAAMMLPLVIHRIWVTAANSLWARRHRAIAGFLSGYFAPWLLLGIAAAGFQETSWTHNYIVPAVCFVVAALWQLTPMHRRALVACHRTYPLAPTGWRADRDCFHFGAMIGAACVRSCWPLMLACAFAGHSPVAMIGGMAVGAAERWWRGPRSRAILAGTAVLASYHLVLAVL